MIQNYCEGLSFAGRRCRTRDERSLRERRLRARYFCGSSRMTTSTRRSWCPRAHPAAATAPPRCRGCPAGRRFPRRRSDGGRRCWCRSRSGRDRPRPRAAGPARELVQRVVDRRERDPHIGACRLAMELLGGDVAVARVEQQLGQRQALARRPQPRRFRRSPGGQRDGSLHGRWIRSRGLPKKRPSGRTAVILE